MDRRDVDAGELDSDVLNAFLADHVDRYGQLPSAAVMPLLDYLRSAGVAAAEPNRRCSLLDEFLGEYRNWLAGERVLSPDTVRGHTRLAHRFLAERVSAQKLGNESLLLLLIDRRTRTTAFLGRLWATRLVHKRPG
jgi:hypothetical protein